MFPFFAFMAFAMLLITLSFNTTTSKATSHMAIYNERMVEFKIIRENEILRRTKSNAFRGGLSGAAAGAAQVLTLMWLRTAVNYQYRYGGTISHALSNLYNEGGLFRFYEGLPFALIQGPLSRFGSIAANEGSIELSKLWTSDGKTSVHAATILGSFIAGLWRVLIMPIDTCKTVLQVEGNHGFSLLMNRVLQGEISLLWMGTIATMLSTIVAHYPWFYVHNYLDHVIPKPIIAFNLVLRSACIGLASSAVSDTISNVIRVVKTVKQAASSSGINLSYVDIVTNIYKEGGLIELFGRGLLLRIISNGIQSMLFTVLWKYFSTFISVRAEQKKIEEP